MLRSRTRRAALLLAVATVVAACSDQLPVQPNRGIPDPVTRPGPVTNSVVHRYTLDVTALPRSGANERWRVRVRVQANLASGRTEIRAVVPQLLTRREVVRPEFAAHAGWEVTLDSGGVAEQVLELPYAGSAGVPALVTVRALGDVPRAQVGRHIVPAAGRFVSIGDDTPSLRAAGSDDGDRPFATGVAIASCAPAKACDSHPLLAEAVPLAPVGVCEAEFRTMPAFANLEGECIPPDDPPDDPQPDTTPAPVHVFARIQFQAHESPFVFPLRRVTVTWSGPGVPGGSGLTDDAGRILVPCSAANGGQLLLQTALVNPTDLRMTQVNTTNLSGVTMGAGCTPPDFVIANWPEASGWEWTLRGILGVRSYFNFSRSRIDVSVKFMQEHISLFSESADQIDLHRPHLSYAVYGGYGVYVGAHEFGHAVHAKLPNGKPGGHCGSSHSFTSPENEACAFVEGFADFISAFVSRADNPYFELIERDQYTSCVPHDHCEGVVAARLMDLADPINLTDLDGYPDLVALPPRQVFDIIGSCRLRVMAFTFPVSYAWIGTHWTQHIKDCLVDVPPEPTDYPVPLGPFGTQRFWIDRSFPYPALTGQTLTDVRNRLTR